VEDSPTRQRRLVPKSLGQVLKAERTRAGLSQSELADSTGLASNHIARLERGEKAFPRFDTVAKLAKELGLSLDWIAAECGLGPKRQPSARALRMVLKAVTDALARQGQTSSDLQRAQTELETALGLTHRRGARP